MTSSSPSASSPPPPPSEATDRGNKRAAERQITKDDREDVDPRDVVAEDPGTGMPVADKDTLSKRRIVRARRPDGSGGGTGGVSTSTSNPFASTSLISDKPKDDQGKDEEKGKDKKEDTAAKDVVFGAGYSGFNQAKTSTGFGFGFGSKASSSGGGFGTAASSSSTSPFSFGMGAGTNTKIAKSGAEDDAGAAAAKTGSESLFTAPAGGFTFGLLKTDGKDGKEGDIDSEAELPSNVSTPAIVKLPEKVKLTTGEEKEKVLHTVRCKSFKWVDKSQVTNDADSAENIGTVDPAANDASLPSVPPSSHFTSTLKNENSKSEDEKDTKPDGNNADEGDNTKDDDGEKTSEADKSVKGESSASRNTEKEDAAENKNAEGNKPKTDAASATPENSEQPTFDWQEIGIGPIRVLQESSGKDDEKEQTELEKQAALFMAAHDGSNDKRVRLVQRRESTPNGNATKVLLNIPIWKESTVSTSSDKYIRVVTPDPATKHAAQYLFKFKTALEAATFKSVLETIIDHLAKSCLGTTKE